MTPGFLTAGRPLLLRGLCSLLAWLWLRASPEPSGPWSSCLSSSATADWPRVGKLVEKSVSFQGTPIPNSLLWAHRLPTTPSSSWLSKISLLHTLTTKTSIKPPAPSPTPHSQFLTFMVCATCLYLYSAILFLNPVEKVNEPNKCWPFSYHHLLSWSYCSYSNKNSQSSLMCELLLEVCCISKSYSNSWNLGFIICTLPMSRLRPKHPKSFDQDHTGWKWIFLKTLVVLTIKYHLFWTFAS